MRIGDTGYRALGAQALFRGALIWVSLMLCPAVVFAGPTVKIGVGAMVSPADTFKYYQAMLDYLGGKIGRTFEMVQQPTYNDMDMKLKAEEVQVALICSGPYVMDKEDFGVELLAAPVSYGRSFYNAYIIVPKDSPARSLGDLRGKSFAFTDPKSNTGRLAPEYMVAKLFNLRPDEFFSKTVYSKSHDKSIEMVAKSIVDGASVDSLIYEYDAKNDPTYTSLTKVIEKSPDYGIPPIVVTKGLEPALKENIKDALLHMHEDPEGKAILLKLMIDRWGVPDDSNYDSVREMQRWLKARQ